MTKVMTVLVAAEQAEKNAIAAAKTENAEENTEIDRQAMIENKLNEVCDHHKRSHRLLICA